MLHVFLIEPTPKQQDFHLLLDVISDQCGDKIKLCAIYTSLSNFKSHHQPNHRESRIFMINIEADGINIGKLVRQSNPNAYIIFYSHEKTDLNHLFQSHYISPIAYLETDGVYPLWDELLSLFTFIVSQEKIRQSPSLPLTFQNQAQFIKILPEELHYIEYMGNHKILIDAQYHRFTVIGNLKDYTHLNYDIIQVHKSFLVNKIKITSIDFKSKFLILNHHHKIPIGDTYRKNLTSI